MSLFEQSVVVAVLVMFILIVQDRLGAIVGGFLAAAPLVSGPSFILAAKVQPASFAIDSSMSALLSCGLSGLCLCFFVFLVRSTGAKLAAALSLGFMFGIAAVILAFNLHEIAIVLLSIAILGLVFLINPKSSSLVGSVSMTLKVKIYCCVATGALVICSSLCAPLIGPYWLGIFTAMPSTSIIIGIAVAQTSGHEQTKLFVRGCWFGLVSKAAFFLVVWFSLEHWTLPLTVAILIGLLSYCLMFFSGYLARSKAA